jgi:hypothetical protein
MIPGRFAKQPYEEFYWGADFADVLDTDNESILLGSSSIKVVDISGREDTSIYYAGSLAIVNTTLLAVKVKGGEEALSPYKITYKIETAAGNKYEKDVLMTVEEV